MYNLQKSLENVGGNLEKLKRSSKRDDRVVIIDDMHTGNFTRLLNAVSKYVTREELRKIADEWIEECTLDQGEPTSNPIVKELWK